jgi:hypothetical protein
MKRFIGYVIILTLGVGILGIQFADSVRTMGTTQALVSWALAIVFIGLMFLGVYLVV